MPELPAELFLHAEEKIEVVAETEDDPLNGLFQEESTVESVLFTGTEKSGAFHNISLPSGTIVYPGSYNPIHEGHVLLALAAQEKFAYQDKEGNKKTPPLVFEISVANADKLPLTPEECYCRLQLILKMIDERNLKNVAVIFTRVPKFVDKSRLFNGCRLLLGHDTLTRIVNPKYYDSETSVLSVLIEIISANNCSFLVGGRHDENDKFHTLTTKFLEKNLGFHPSHIFGSRLSFIGLDENEFKLQISSTEIRLAQQSKKVKLEGGEGEGN
jgi:nicotinic acid mononucleotide adenylyltransferase